MPPSCFHFDSMVSTAGTRMESESFQSFDPQSMLLDDGAEGGGDGSNTHEAAPGHSGQRSKTSRGKPRGC